MKRVLKVIQILLLLAVLLFSSMGLNYVYATDGIASGSCGNSITWSLNSNGILTITGNGAMSGSSCAWADYKDQVKEVVFNGNITSISACAFEYNTKLEKVTLPDSITIIDRRAFAECTNLKTVVFPKNLRTIGTSSFYKCSSLEAVDIPEDVLYVNENAFAECTSLKTAIVRSSIALVGDAEGTFNNTAQIYGYKYSSTFYYARYYGRTFTELDTNKTTTTTITNQTFLDALPKSMEALGITSHGGRSYSGNILNGYRTSFCNEKDTTNETYKNIKAKVEELTAGCTTDREKAYAIFRWAFINIDYVYAYGASADIDRVYSIFNEKRGNCEAYTMLTNYMLYLCGIPTATASNLTHEWSVALVDGEWIHIDSTQNRFGNTTPNKINQISFAYDGLVYIIDDPLDGGKVTGIAKTASEIEELNTFTIPTNSYMKDIYSTAFDKDIELKAEIGTIGEEFIKENRLYWVIEGNQIRGGNDKINSYLLGDMDKNGEITPYDAFLINVIYEEGRTPTNEELQIGDIDRNGELTAYDAYKINVAYENGTNLE